MTTIHLNSVCPYCHIDSTLRDKHGFCLGCGSGHKPIAIESTKPLYEKHEPFPYNGLMVWPIRDYARDTYQFQFWAGDRLLEILSFSSELWHSMREQLDPATDSMSFIWRMFEVAHGDRDLQLILDNSRRVPAILTITRTEYPRDLLTWETLIEQYKQNPADVIHFQPNTHWSKP